MGFVYVDGSSVGEITEADLKDRRILGDEGFISIITVIHRATGKVVSGPEIHARGVAEDDSVFDEIIPKINAALEEAVLNHTDHTSTSSSRWSAAWWAPGSTASSAASP